jgi:hypothetical protein
MLSPNLDIEIHDCVPSSHSRASCKTIIEPTGATQILHKPLKYEHSTYSKNSISRFGLRDELYLADVSIKSDCIKNPCFIEFF